MDRVSARQLPVAIRLIREPVVVTYSYPRNHPLYGAGEELGVYIPMELFQKFSAVGALGDLRTISPGIKLPDLSEPLETVAEAHP